jgi:hypothetical protein
VARESVHHKPKGETMKLSFRLSVGLLVAAFMFTGVAANSAMAQEKGKAAKAEKGKAVSTILAENDKVRAWETRYKPGDENSAPASSTTRVIRILKGGSMLWTFADGKTEKKDWKSGEVIILVPGPQFTVKNVGKSELSIYVVALK